MNMDRENDTDRKGSAIVAKVAIEPTPFQFRPYIPQKFAHLHRWGPWLLDAERLVLCLCRDHDEPLRSRYEVDIERIETAEDLLFWISHIAMKN
ncbi:hypothetical protein GGR43_000763 [Sphingobium jiangsuense]|uniref:Uncharacterized protein n=1 Tax=Sphingobium jiangsuense TaxID=870476 RepID=A0A7W6FP06_9SPHN|nr:hypothetical protein [Sphingobium jiangsuense]MBB3925062.1 hypothetical protein [Sphingobium jiangsuense]